MKLKDEEEYEMKKTKNKKIKQLMIMLVILLFVLCMIIVVIIIYKINNPSKITTYIDGVMVRDFDKTVDFTTDENGNLQMYIPIRDFATYLNAVNQEFEYKTFKGDYNPKTEEEDKCYILRDKYEVAMFTKKSNKIYKLNLQGGDEDYEECQIDREVYENNGKLYTSVNGIETGYNVSFSYNEKKKVITIYTLDYLVQSYQMALENKNIGDYGILSLKDKSYVDCKSIFEGLLIIQASNNKFGIVRAENYEDFILEPQYDDISFINDSSTFVVSSNGKIGLFSKEGKRKINLVYDEIISMGQKSKLYVVKTNNMYGVVNEDGDIIIHPEYEKIGADISRFSYNGVKNGYLLLNELIPVLKDKRWAFFNKEGKILTDGFLYEEIGCSRVDNVNNVYPMLEVPNCNAIVVGDEYGKYSFMSVTGDNTILPFVFEEIYIKISEGKKSYWMRYKEKEYDVLKYLKQLQ